MSKPYDYMVARMLLNLANKSEGLEFTTVEHALGEVRRTCQCLMGHSGVSKLTVSGVEDLFAR